MLDLSIFEVDPCSILREQKDTLLEKKCNSINILNRAELFHWPSCLGTCEQFTWTYG